MRISDRTYVSFFILLMTLVVFSPFISALQKNVLGIPNVLSAFKDLCFIIFFFLVILRFGSKQVTISLLLSLFAFFFFAFLYAYTSIIDNRIKEGLYYLRLHMLPYLFLVACYYFFPRIAFKRPRPILRSILVINALSNVISILSYFVTISNPLSLYRFSGYDTMQSSFIISGANLLRLTLPQASPNTLGLFLALNVALFLFALGRDFYNPQERAIVKIMCLVDFILIVLTFSRSTFVFIFVLIAIMVFFSPNKYLLKAVKLVAVVLPLIVIGSVVANQILDDKLYIWMELNLTFQDPSIKGHTESYKQVLNDFDEYHLQGYERGRVGPRAFLFRPGEVINPESSLLALLYDMGIFQISFLFLSYFILLLRVVKSVGQVAVLTGMLASLQFLPNVYETDIIVYFIIILCLLAVLPRKIAAGEAITVYRPNCLPEH